MVLPLGLKHLVDERQVNWIIGASPDELAPQLSQIIYRLLHEEAKHLREVAIPFVNTTVLTRNFRTILEEVFKKLHENGVLTKWLNLDMGSGKTHLLTLIVYLLYGYDTLEEYLEEEYHRLGLDRSIAERTALFVVDLRTPSEIMTTFFPFFVKSLRKAREEDAAQYVENCIRRGAFPEASELARRLRRDTRLVIIIDELHHAVLTYRASETERRWVINTLSFVMQLLNYLRHFGRGFVILVASARRDYERVLKIERDELVIAAENLISQLGRLEPVLETEWLSVDEAKQIILKKLGAKKDVFHRLFDRFIERIIRAESDIPQAQHLRSLIKAMAVYTKNAIELGHRIVSPASFSEGVIDALFPEGDVIAERYKSIYNQVMREVKLLENVSEETKVLAEMIINTIFTMSISGRPDQLIETIKAYKLGRYTLELLPAVPEYEIRSLLEDLDYRNYVEMDKAFDVLSGIPYIHSVRVGNAYVYFVVPVESVVAMFNRYIEERYKSNLMDREALVDKLIGYLYILSGKVGENSYITVVGDYKALEDSTKRLDPNSMYLLVYADPGLVKYLEKSLRGVAQADIDELIRKWFVSKGLKDLSTWLSEHQKHNVAIAVPIPKEDVIKGIAKFEAIKDATAKVVNEYLLEYVRSGSRLPDMVRRIIEVELEDIHRDIGEKFVDAVRSFVSACSSALSHVYIYECSYSPESGVKCYASLKNTRIESSVVRIPTTIPVNQSTYSRLLDMLESYRGSGVKDLVGELLNRIKKYANFVDDTRTARSIISTYIAEELKKPGVRSVTISKDMNIYIRGSSILYIPPDKVIGAARSIAEDEIKKLIGEDISIIKRVEGESIVFEVQRKGERPPPPPPPLPPPSPPYIDKFSRALAELEKHERGFISLTIEFNRESKHTIRTYLTILKKYVKDIEVKPVE